MPCDACHLVRRPAMLDNQWPHGTTHLEMTQMPSTQNTVKECEMHASSNRIMDAWKSQGGPARSAKVSIETGWDVSMKTFCRTFWRSQAPLESS